MFFDGRGVDREKGNWFSSFIAFLPLQNHSHSLFLFYSKLIGVLVENEFSVANLLQRFMKRVIYLLYKYLFAMFTRVQLQSPHGLLPFK